MASLCTGYVVTYSVMSTFGSQIFRNMGQIWKQMGQRPSLQFPAFFWWIRSIKIQVNTKEKLHSDDTFLFLISSFSEHAAILNILAPRATEAQPKLSGVRLLIKVCLLFSLTILSHMIRLHILITAHQHHYTPKHNYCWVCVCECVYTLCVIKKPQIYSSSSVYSPVNVIYKHTHTQTKWKMWTRQSAR